MAVSDFSLRLEDLFGDIANTLEAWCIEFNKYAIIYFQSIKFIFAIILLMCGISTLLKLRGFYFKSRLISSDKNVDKADLLTKPKLILGCVYIVLGFGILFNYLTYFLIWFLDPLPDRLIFSMVSLIDIDPYAINRITDIHSAIFPHEKTIYYGIAMLSFGHTIHLTLSIWYFLAKVKNPRDTMIRLFEAVPGSILFGFTTFMPFML
jgi:hypothetical protein